MNKYHIWFWPFSTSDQEYQAHLADLEHLYPDNRRGFIFVDKSVENNQCLRSKIGANTKSSGTIVSIYVMGHTNIGLPQLRSREKSNEGECIDSLVIATRLNWIFQVIDRDAEIKVKFMNCRSAHASYPHPTCAKLANLSGRVFTGYAYALDICTKTLNDNGVGYQTSKRAFFKTEGGKIQDIRAKDARFEVWPKLKEVQNDESSLQDFLGLLQ